VEDLVGDLVEGRLLSHIQSHYFGLLQRMIDASIVRPRKLGAVLTAGYWLASRLTLVEPSYFGAGNLVREMNLLMLLDIVYRGTAYKDLVDSLDKIGRKVLSNYICVIACLVGVEELCCPDKLERRRDWFASVSRRIYVVRRIKTRHTSGRRLMLVKVTDEIGPPMLVTDSIDILVESLTSLSPRFLHHVTGGARTLSIIDVGAYNGETSLRYAALAKKMGSRSVVYAVEPDPISYRVLVFNSKLVGHAVKPVNVFLSDREGVEELISRGPSSSSRSLIGRGNGVRVRVVPAWRVASWALSDLENAHLHVRVDTEGAEEQVIRGLMPVLERLKSFSIEVAVYHRLGDLLRFYNIFRDLAHGFTLTWSSMDFRDLMLVAYRHS